MTVLYTKYKAENNALWTIYVKYGLKIYWEVWKFESGILKHCKMEPVFDTQPLCDVCVFVSRQLEYNNLTEVSKGWLYGLLTLQQLHLSHNTISRIKPDAWEFCQKLAELWVCFTLTDTLFLTSLSHHALAQGRKTCCSFAFVFSCLSSFIVLMDKWSKDWS